jgi:hypothetical protein
MKFLIQLVATALVGFVLQSFFPWWTLAIGAFCVAYSVGNKSLISFTAGFLGSAILWLVVALYLDQTTHSIITDKVNKLLPLNAFILTTLVGGLVGGFSALSGSLAKAR